MRTARSALDQVVRAKIYQHFVHRAAPPTNAELAQEIGIPREDLAASLDRLVASRALVLAPDSGEIWMAHPFSGRETEHLVELGAKRYYANCAWDALAIPSFVGGAARSTCPCPDCGEPLSWSVDEDGRLDHHPSGAVVHFAVPARQFWRDIGFT